MRVRFCFFFFFLFFLVGYINSEELVKSDAIDNDIGLRLIVGIDEGFVPNAKIAIEIAEIILVYQYGSEILKNRPFVAELVEDGKVWYVKGTYPNYEKNGYRGGGVPHIKLKKATGEIIGFIHGE